MIFRNPFYLILLLLTIPFLLSLFQKNRQRQNSNWLQTSNVLHYSDISVFKSIKPNWKVRGSLIMPWFTFIAIVLIIIALARPQIGLKQSLIHQGSIDIVLTIDISPSMLAEDFTLHGKRTNRLEVIKAVARDFIEKRPDDRIGIIIFAGQPYVLSPLTWDHEWCLSRLDELQVGMIDEGTAIGSALASSINRLHSSTAKSKVVILLTDGNNNAGQIAPEAATKAAKSLSIIVYTIGAGSKGLVPYPTFDQSGHKTYQNVRIDLDQNLLKQIAEITGGRYFRATDTQALATIFKRINKMERSRSNLPNYQEYRDLYPLLLILAFSLLFLETILANTIFRRIP